jgi:hypothetical protein
MPERSMHDLPASGIDAAELERTLRASIALMKRKRHELQRAARRKPDRESGATEGRRTHQ